MWLASVSVIENEALKKAVDTSDEWIQTRTGIASRYISETENTSDLAIRAAQKAIQSGQIDGSQISMIIVATCTPDNVTPSVACIVQEALGLNDKPVMAFDINAACSGFLFALQCAASMLQKGYALVIGAETLSKILDWSDRNTCVLFGDGAGADRVGGEGRGVPLHHRRQGFAERALGTDDTGDAGHPLPASGRGVPLSHRRAVSDARAALLPDRGPEGGHRLSGCRLYGMRQNAGIVGT